jgi:hypothetical protein
MQPGMEEAPDISMVWPGSSVAIRPFSEPLKPTTCKRLTSRKRSLVMLFLSGEINDNTPGYKYTRTKQLVVERSGGGSTWPEWASL